MRYVVWVVTSFQDPGLVIRQGEGDEPPTYVTDIHPKIYEAKNPAQAARKCVFENHARGVIETTPEVRAEWAVSVVDYAGDKLWHIRVNMTLSTTETKSDGQIDP